MLFCFPVREERDKEHAAKMTRALEEEEKQRRERYVCVWQLCRCASFSPKRNEKVIVLPTFISSMY